MVQREPTMCKEIALLLRCASKSINPTQADEIEAMLSAGLDWRRLFRLARRHGVVPLLAAHRTKRWQARIPRWFVKELQDDARTIALHNWVRTRELLRLLDVFGAAAIPAVPFKGPVLAISAYGSLSLRQFLDLDLLVHEADVARTKDLLIANGYRLKYDLDWQSHLVNEDLHTEIDLHWELTGKRFPFSFDMEALWNSLEPLSLGSKDVLCFSRENTLLLLCVTAVREIYAGWYDGMLNVGLLKICDIAHLASSSGSMDWKFLVREAERLGCEGMVWFGLGLADDLIGVALPDHIAQKVRLNPARHAYADWVGQTILAETHNGRPSAPGRERFVFCLLNDSPNNIRYRFYILRRLLYLLFTPTMGDKSVIRLPGL